MSSNIPCHILSYKDNGPSTTSYKEGRDDARSHDRKPKVGVSERVDVGLGTRAHESNTNRGPWRRSVALRVNNSRMAKTFKRPRCSGVKGLHDEGTQHAHPQAQHFHMAPRRSWNCDKLTADLHTLHPSLIIITSAVPVTEPFSSNAFNSAPSYANYLDTTTPLTHYP